MLFFFFLVFDSEEEGGVGREDLGQLCQILCCLYAFSWIAVLIFTPIFKLVGGRQAIYKKHLLIQTNHGMGFGSWCSGDVTSILPVTTDDGWLC